MSERLSVSCADSDLLELVASYETGAELVLWDMSGDAPRETFDMVIAPHRPPWARGRRALDVPSRLVQLCFIGYDQWVGTELPPGTVIANASGVAEPITAELALTLMLSAQRDIPSFLDLQRAGGWASTETRSLLGSRVVIVGAGGIGSAIARLLKPFDVELSRVARTARVDELGKIHAIAELPRLAAGADILVVAVPSTTETRGLVDAALLEGLPDGALLVNIGRGATVDTAALLAELESGRLRAALDVVDPEPLPAGHPLRFAPGTIITPHVGPLTSRMLPRVAGLVADQIRRLQSGRTPRNVVLDGGRR